LVQISERLADKLPEQEKVCTRDAARGSGRPGSGRAATGISSCVLPPPSNSLPPHWRTLPPSSIALLRGPSDGVASASGSPAPCGLDDGENSHSAPTTPKAASRPGPPRPTIPPRKAAPRLALSGPRCG